MTPLPIFQVDAFAEKPFTGNPAAVMPLDHWLSDEVMQAIAAENNLSETAFTVPSERGDADYDLRWFTPAVEVPLCGHATLAAGHILMHGQEVRFATRSGALTVARDEEDPGLLKLDLPAAPLSEVSEPDVCAALGLSDRPLWFAEGCNDSVIVAVESEAEVRAVAPELCPLDVTHATRCLGGPRLYEAARRAGLRDTPLAPAGVNPLPHPFP